MNKDFRVSTGFFRNHKTIKLKRRLGASGVCSLMALWAYAAETKPYGVLSGLDAEDIAIAAEWDEDAETFVRNLCEVGFLEQRGDGFYALHDWDEHNPYVAGSVERSNKGRLSRLAGTNRALYEKLRAAGFESISAEELEAFKKSLRSDNDMKGKAVQDGNVSNRDPEQDLNASSTVVEQALTHRQRGVTKRLTPSPSPSPSPKTPPIVPPPGGAPASSPAPSKAQVERDARLVLAHLNERKGSAFRKLGNIRARLREGATVDECKAVIDAKMQDPHFRENPQYLNPETLFRASKWERYVEEARHPPASWRKRRSVASGWSAGAGQWDTVVRLAQQGRYRERMSDHLDPPGVAALMALGGLNAVGAADSFELARLKKAFLERYDVECGAGAQAVGA